MSWTHTLLVVAAAFFAVFLQAAFPVTRWALGAQVDLLPPLIVYTALSGGLFPVSLAAVWGGLFFDALSANPLGTTILPLLAAGILVHAFRDLILRTQVFAQVVIGTAAGFFVPLGSLFILFHSGQQPMFGWGTLWQLVVMGAGGGALTPLVFRFFEWINRHFTHAPLAVTSFRSDREIRRGRI